MKINYILDNENYIKSYIKNPFDINKPFIEIPNLDNIILNKTRIINGVIDNNSVGNKAYLKKLDLEAQKPLQKLRKKRKTLLEAFDKYKTNINYGIVNESSITKVRIINWYNDLLNLVESAFVYDNIPNEIKYYL